jgi:uncharacterized protein YdeI (YjbR/CyaY-like superfamily)
MRPHTHGLTLLTITTAGIVRGVADELPVLHFRSREALAAWLAEHCEQAPGCWLKLARAGAGADSVSYAEAIELGLAHGWIDGQKRALDDEFWLQRFTPRGPRSRWSRINRDKAVALIESGRMTPPGLAAVEQAKADGRWERAYEGAATITVPDDLRRALDASSEAAAFFATLDGSNRYAVLYRIGEAKKPETRARRIEKFVAMLERGETLHPRPTG